MLDLTFQSKHSDWSPTSFIKHLKQWNTCFTLAVDDWNVMCLLFSLHNTFLIDSSRRLHIIEDNSVNKRSISIILSPISSQEIDLYPEGAMQAKVLTCWDMEPVTIVKWICNLRRYGASYYCQMNLQFTRKCGRDFIICRLSAHSFGQLSLSNVNQIWISTDHAKIFWFALKYIFEFWRKYSTGIPVLEITNWKLFSSQEQNNSCQKINI